MSAQQGDDRGDNSFRPHLLLGMSTGTRPLRNDIFSGLIVGRKGKSYTRKGGTKVDPHDELGLTAPGSFNLDGIAHVLLRLRLHGRGDWRGDGLLYPVSWRRRPHGLDGLGILNIGIQRSRMMGQLLTWRQGTGRSAVRVTRGPAQGVLVVVHGEARGGRTGLGGGRTGRGRTIVGVGRRRDKSLSRGIGDMRSRRRRRVGGSQVVVVVVVVAGGGGRGGGGGGASDRLVLVASRPKPERFQAGTHQVHVKSLEGRAPGEKREEKEEKKVEA